MPILNNKKAEFLDLFQEFVESYPSTDLGQIHTSHYSEEREAALKNLKSIILASERGEDVTEQVLKHLLPYGGTQQNQDMGYWISIAPAFNCDVRKKYEPAGWTKPEDWPRVAQAILKFIRRCYENPEDLASACAEFDSSPYSKGFQAGTLTPILHALRPDDFILINNKSRSIYNYFADNSYSQGLNDYPELNRLARSLVTELSEEIHKFDVPDIRDDDLIDMFGHWLIAIKKYINPREMNESKSRKNSIELNLGKSDNIVEPILNKSYWVFQSNPKYYDLEKDLEGATEEYLDNFTWTVNQHADQIHTGDVAYLWTSGKDAGILAVATVTSDPYYTSEVEGEFISDKKKKEGKQQWVNLRIDYILPERIRRDNLVDHPTLRSMQIIRGPQGTNFVVTNEEAEALNALIHTGRLPKEYPLSQFADDTGFDLATLESWVRAIRRKKQAILYGPPGTGKTYVAEHLARHLIGGGDGFKDLVQFHPAYAYEDFIQGIRPHSDEDGGLKYPLVPGRFLEFCERARSCTGTCVLIIDEINRANLSQVFGELMYLLEYRDEEIALAGGGNFRIPENVLIIGTMNTADRSIALVDHALRRRFAFLRLQPDHDVLRKYHQDSGFQIEGLIGVLSRLNYQINDPHYEIGISFFLQKKLSDEIEDIWKMEIEPYLEEYFFDQAEKVRDFRWDKVRSEILR